MPFLALLKTVLKDEVTGLRGQHEDLEAAVEERERRLHSKEAEIQDLKDTVAQLQTLVFTSDGEVREGGRKGGVKGRRTSRGREERGGVDRKDEEADIDLKKEGRVR